VNLNTNFDSTGNVVQKDNRMLAGVLVLIAVAGLGFSLMSKRWLSNTAGRGDVGFGLLSFSACSGGDGGCETMSNSAVIDKIKAEHEASANSGFPIVGYATFGIIAISLLGLVGSAVLAFRKQADAEAMLKKFPVSPTKIALAGLSLALIVGCIFVALKPGGVGAVGVGWGFWAFGAAEIVGLLGVIMIAKQLAPKTDEAWKA
jgi:hypothetical protein